MKSQEYIGYNKWDRRCLLLYTANCWPKLINHLPGYNKRNFDNFKSGKQRQSASQRGKSQSKKGKKGKQENMEKVTSLDKQNCKRERERLRQREREWKHKRKWSNLIKSYQKSLKFVHCALPQPTLQQQIRSSTPDTLSLTATTSVCVSICHCMCMCVSCYELLYLLSWVYYIWNWNQTCRQTNTHTHCVPAKRDWTQFALLLPLALYPSLGLALLLSLQMKRWSKVVIILFLYVIPF